MQLFNFRTRAIVKREVRQQIFSKRFIFTTLALPLFLLVVVAMQFLFFSLSGGDNGRLYIFSDNQNTLDMLQAQFELSDRTASASGIADFENQEDMATEQLDLQYEVSTAAALELFIENQRETILSGEISAVLFVPGSALQDKQVLFYSNNAGNQNLLNRIRFVVNNVVLDAYVDERNLNSDIIDFVRLDVDVQSIRVTGSGNQVGGAGAQQAVAIFFTFLLYFSLLVIAAPVMGSVNEEKVSRVVEVVLSSVSASELMAGKIIGSAIAGFCQMLIWLIPVVLVATGSLPLLVSLSDLSIQLEFSTFLYFLLNYLIGVLTFLSIFSAFGAMFDNPQDAQSAMFPVMMLIIVPFLLAFAVVNNPASTLGLVGSMLPFAAILVMPARMLLIDVPIWQFGVAVLVNVLTLYLVILLCGKIYRFTILMTGKQASWKEIYKWFKYKG
tara:strand:+ start:3743 stop:5068 length:1326 start_codon:yes stop_codon:yes gene_type:complete